MFLFVMAGSAAVASISSANVAHLFGVNLVALQVRKTNQDDLLSSKDFIALLMSS